jgi:pyridoxamine 5'-phosphate oxidase
VTTSIQQPISMKEKLRQIPSLKPPLPDVDFSIFPPTPHEAFALWLDDALAAGMREPHAMTLSTSDADGRPDARILILKNVDRRGWHFAIKAGSPKAMQVDSQPQVALTFYWPALGRQIRLRGIATLLPAEECAADFLDRPIGARISAVASRQSEVLEDEGQLEANISKARILFKNTPDYVSPAWRVYAVAPDTVEFWQGVTDRKHKRLRYELTEDKNEWKNAVLWP